MWGAVGSESCGNDERNMEFVRRCVFVMISPSSFFNGKMWFINPLSYSFTVDPPHIPSLNFAFSLRLHTGPTGFWTGDNVTDHLSSIIQEHDASSQSIFDPSPSSAMIHRSPSSLSSHDLLSSSNVWKVCNSTDYVGVTCDTNDIYPVQIKYTSGGPQSLYLNGTIPAAIGSLTNLTLLALGGNPMTGSIPDSLCEWWEERGGLMDVSGNLTQLTYMNLGTMKLTGSIPSCIGNLQQLDTAYLVSGSLLVHHWQTDDRTRTRWVALSLLL